jgi:hypothetical protein
MSFFQAVRAELEALSFFMVREKGMGFDRLSPNGISFVADGVRVA